MAGSKTMNYKASFPGAEVWDGDRWQPLGGRDPAKPEVQRVLRLAEQQAMAADAGRFCLEAARELPRRG